MKETLAQWLGPVNEALANRQPRERALLALALVAAILGGWFYQIHQPQQEALQQARSAYDSASAEIPGLEAQRDDWQSRIEEEPDPDEPLREEIAELEAELEELEADLTERMPDFIPPEEMRRVLAGALEERSGVRMETFQRRPAELAMEAESEEGEPLRAYRHPVTVRVAADDFAAAVSFLRDIEGLPWQFAWEDMSYEVQSHPQARLELRLHTLGGYEHWLGL